jgi:hypothetical protein
MLPGAAGVTAPQRHLGQDGSVVHAHAPKPERLQVRIALLEERVAGVVPTEGDLEMALAGSGARHVERVVSGLS